MDNPLTKLDLQHINNMENNDTKTNNILIGAFDAGYKACLKEALNWLKTHVDYYTWYNEMVCESGVTDDFYQDLEKYLRNKLEVNDL